MAVSKEGFSPHRNEIFRPLDKPLYLLNDERWPDLYAILETPRDASPAELDTAIIEATSQLFATDFSRGKTLRMRLIEHFTSDFRVVLLDPARRARYDALLLRHERDDETAMPYPTFFAGEWGESLLQRARRRARTLGERLSTTWRESPYI